MSAFSNVSATGIGTTPSTIFTATEKTVVIGCNMSNVINQIVPVSLIFNDGSNDVYIKKNFRIENGFSDEIMKGNKIVLDVGDSIKASAAIDSSVDVVLSLLTGVN
jgi:hypothetical protein